jgi:predicted NAD/FAD-dependent oxidoreductase
LLQQEAVVVTRVAVVGAGFAGLVVARYLQSHADVTIFEKSRGAGGRMATRYVGDFEFDHGAQFFTARSDAFQAFLQPLIDEGVVADWKAQFAEFDRSSATVMRTWGNDHPHYVGAPRMNSVGKYLSEHLDIRLETEITAIVRRDDGWTLSDRQGKQFGSFHWLVMTAPAAQTADLAAGFPDLVTYSGERSMLACFALMLGFEEPLDLQWDAALIRNANISWISVNSSKPARKRLFTLVAHSTNAWADAHLEDGSEFVVGHMLDEGSLITGMDLRTAVHCQVHRWRYANIAGQAGPKYFMDDVNGLAACGDWCMRGRVEAAFTSAYELAKSLIHRV